MKDEGGRIKASKRKLLVCVRWLLLNGEVMNSSQSNKLPYTRGNNVN